MEELKQLLNNNSQSTRIVVFFVSLIAGLLMSILPTLGISKIVPEWNLLNSQLMVNSLPEKKDPLENVYQKLEQKKNNYTLQKSSYSILNSAVASENEYNQSKSFALIDFESGEIIDEKNLSEKIPIASLTKIMTAVVTLDLASPSDRVTITKTAAEIEPTKIGVVEGQKMKIEELLKAILLTSANDAAEALKEGINAQYGNEIFIKSMNAKAKAIGLENTSFTNPQGFDANNHFSTAEDLAILAHYAVNNYPLIAEYAKLEYAFLPEDENHKQFDLYNWNGLLGVYPGVTGLKIGNTDAAGKTTIVIAEREQKKILVVLLGAPSILERDLWASMLLDSGFEKKYGFTPINVTEEQLKTKYKTWKYWE